MFVFGAKYTTLPQAGVVCFINDSASELESPIRSKTVGCVVYTVHFCIRLQYPSPFPANVFLLRSLHTTVSFVAYAHASPLLTLGFCYDMTIRL